MLAYIASLLPPSIVTRIIRVPHLSICAFPCDKCIDNMLHHVTVDPTRPRMDTPVVTSHASLGGKAVPSLSKAVNKLPKAAVPYQIVQSALVTEQD
jgi:hypothetical protein